MKRKHRRHLKTFGLFLSGLVIVLMATNTMLPPYSTVSDFQSQHQFQRTIEVNQMVVEQTPSTAQNTTVSRIVRLDTNSPVSIQDSLSKKDLSNRRKVHIVNEWKLKRPTTDVKRSDDVILRLGYPRPRLGFLTIGLSTVPRVGASYLLETIGYLMEAMGEIEKKEVVIVIFLASLDDSWSTETIDHLQDRFHDQIKDGLILAIQPKPHIYPNFSTITKRNFNDSLERVYWRTKQNVDYAYLFSYCRNISEYYIHIEDDVSPAESFISIIKNYIFRFESKPWFCIDFSSLGFIGKLFHTSSLQIISEFLLMFKEEQPCDLLLNHLKLIMVQDKSVRSRRSLFQHRGVISSLENKKQGLIDERFKAGLVYHRKHYKKRRIVNPSAIITTNLSQYRTFSPEKAYIFSEPDYFWCTSPTKGSYYSMEFEKPVNLTHIFVQTGHPDRGSDKLVKGEIRLGFASEHSKCGRSVTIAKFVHGAVDINTWQSSFPSNINCVTILVLEDQIDWLIINEIGLY